MAATSSGNVSGLQGLLNTQPLLTLGKSLPALLKKLLEQIWAEEYIDFSDLPPAKGKTLALPSQMEGQVILVQLQDVENCKK